MKGRSSAQTGLSPISKWTAVAKELRNIKIGLIALQETHLSEPLADQVSTLFNRKLTIFNSPSPMNPTGSAGVAFAVNKELLNTEDIAFHVIIPGRVILLSFRWQRNMTISIMNVYAPNDLTKHPDFWSELENRWTDLRLPNPDLMVGDFNMTEDTIDRAPARPDNENAVLAL